MIEGLALGRRAVGVAGIGLAVARQTAELARALIVGQHLARPALARAGRVTRHGGQLAAGCHDQAHVGVLRAQRAGVRVASRSRASAAGTSVRRAS